jgi:hypothetical protein
MFQSLLTLFSIYLFLDSRICVNRFSLRNKQLLESLSLKKCNINAFTFYFTLETNIFNHIWRVLSIFVIQFYVRYKMTFHFLQIEPTYFSKSSNRIETGSVRNRTGPISGV